MHISVPIANTMEFVNATKVSPLISKVQIKVCYVGQDPNRNGTVITKDVATKMGQSLKGCPIVGYYNKQQKDFESHNREVSVEDGKFEILDTTKPYGFVDTNAEIWFQKFLDDGVEHEYLCTEGYLWTEIYEECKRVTEIGNNQSMELHGKSEKGFWTEDNNSGRRIFIINDGLIEKLCILGSNVEPCFEGSQIKSHFSFDNSPEFAEFKSTMFSMINELKDALSKGGSNVIMENEKNITTPGQEEETLENSQFAKKPEEDKEKKEKNDDSSSDNNSDSKPEDKKKGEEEDDKDKKKCKYELTEIAEYVALQLQYTELQNKYAALEQENGQLSAEVTSLREFKLKADRKSKQDMVDSFYMLSDEDKREVVENIDKFSLDDIEAKLSIICVKNRVDFSLGDDKNTNNQQLLFNLNQNNGDSDDAPAWVKVVRNKQG